MNRNEQHTDAEPSAEPLRRETYAEIKKRYSHDAFCKEKLRDPVKAKELAKHILKPEVAARLDIDNLQIDQESYIEDDLKKLFSDVVYRIPVKESDESIVVFILIELKTENEKWTIFQLAKYVIRIWDRELKLAEKEKRLDTFLFPMIIPVIFHHGASAFTAPTELMTLVRVIQGLEAFTLNMNSILFDVTPLGENELPENTELAVFLMVLHAVFSDDTMQKLLRVLQKLQSHLHLPEVQKDWQDHLYYALVSAKNFSREQCEKVYQKTNESGVVTMSTTLIDQLYTEGKAEGETIGFEKGIEKGIEIERNAWATDKVETLSRILARNFGDVPPTVQDKLHAIHDLDVLGQLTDVALDCQSFDQFEQALSSAVSNS